MLSKLELLFRKLEEFHKDGVIIKSQVNTFIDKISRVFITKGIINGDLENYLQQDLTSVRKVEGGKELRLHFKNKDKTIILTIHSGYGENDKKIQYTNCNRIRYEMFNFHNDKVLSETIMTLLEK